MLIGQTQDLLNQAKFNQFSLRAEIKEGKNVFRILSGPYLSRLVFWPTLSRNQEGKLTVSMRSVQIPKEGSKFLSTLANVEKEARRLLGENEPTSQFKPATYYLYLVFDRSDPKPIVKVAPLKYTIFKRLEEIQSEISSNDETKLKNGLIFMYDVIIRKTVGDARRPRFTTKYSVDPDSENNRFMGKVPKEFLTLTSAELNKVLEDNNLYPEIFTPEELAAIESCDINLEQETTPLSDEEIIAKMIESPIYLKAQDHSGRYYFPQSDLFIKALEANQVKYIDFDPEKVTDQASSPKEAIIPPQTFPEANTTPPPSFTGLTHSTPPKEVKQPEEESSSKKENDQNNPINSPESILKRWE